LCSTEALTNVSLGILDDVKFTHHSVEFIIVLSAAGKDAIWLKDGGQVAPSSPSFKAKYSSSVDASGITHTLTVHDVHAEDEGVYTFVVRRPYGYDLPAARQSIRYHIEGSDQANEAALRKVFEDRQSTTGTPATNIGTGDR